MDKIFKHLLIHYLFIDLKASVTVWGYACSCAYLKETIRFRYIKVYIDNVKILWV